MDELREGDPQRIGAYRLLGRLGAGGMGRVYLARSDRGRTAAVKLVRRELAAQGEFRDRFRREVRAARRVGGRWTAPVLDADTEAALPWVATGYIAGPSLQRLVGEHGPLPERSVRVLAASLAAALEDIHAAGLVHRDLKPSNVLVTIDGPRVIDFGIARALETATDGGPTRTGAMVGSPGFMAPEQVRGERITPACDVFCLGSVLVHAATGRTPFGGAESDVPALLYRIAREEPDLTGLPDGLRDLVTDCLRKDPAGRPAPAELRERSGADATLGDGRALEPWLPGRVVAQLGQHAVRLLDAEDPASAGDPDPAPEAAPAADRPAAGTGHAYGDGHGLLHGAEPAREEQARAQARERLYEPTPEHTPAGGPGTGTGTGPYGNVPYANGPYGVQHGDGRADRTGREGRWDREDREDRTAREQHHQAPPAAHPGHPAQPGHPGHPGTAHFPPPPPPGSAPPASTPYYGPPPPGSGYGYGTRQYNTTPGYLPPYRPDHAAPDGSSGATRHWRISALVTAMALAVAVIGGTTVYTLLKDDGATGQSRDRAAGRQGGAPESPNSPNPDTDPDADSAADSSPRPSPGAVPQEYLGTWEAAFGTAEQDVRRFTLVQGGPGDPVFRLDADGPGYHCEFSARLRGVGPPVELSPSTVEVAQPATACRPGPVTTLELEPDGGLRRVFSEGTEKPLVYTRID
ncbi:serine/threonine protein kinase [Streptomyces sp. F63]|uniref:serine/threonine-protein kinase n=1 Tax=Streptomyces sp. F63 TaxID=2824887 RepID=UPI001B391CBD|nr:serine/threonine-protein kinase [Streptomyces sp. F63]MBQ0983011.1 serine/threonine protein kinase [Streptomyces sp. F63]